MGFLLLALSVFTSSSSSYNQSVESFVFYIIQYTITNLNIFLIILALSYIINKKIDISYFNNTHNILKKESSSIASSSIKRGWNEIKARNFIINRLAVINTSDIEYINSLKGIFFKNPLLSISLSICLFSFAGVPPLIGFFAKQQVLYSSNSAGYFFLSLTAILVSVISAFYYLKIIKIVFSNPNLNRALSDSKLSNKNETLFPIAFTGPVPVLAESLTQIKKISNITVGTTKLNLNLEKIELNQDVESTKGVHLIKSQLLSNIHSLLIGILTIFIIIFIFNPELLLNSIAIISSLILNI